MKHKKLLLTAVAAANAVSIAAAVIMTVVGSSMAKSQSYNYIGSRWDPDGGSTQMSCYLSEDAGLTTDQVPGAAAVMYSALQSISVTPEEGQKLILSAYSTPAGQVTVRSDTTTGRSEAQLTAVGGDFFMFRDLRLLDGAYFSDSDIMQDGAVIDRSLAWSLYGSEKVSGMSMYINGTKFYIAGVVDLPKTKPEKITVGELPLIYVSYAGAELLHIGGEDGGALKRVTCYECICPEPVENYAINAFTNYFEGSYRDRCAVVNNSTRFSPSVRAKAHKDMENYAVSTMPVVYPYWENASRIVEFRLTSLYFYRRFTYVIPVLTALVLIAYLWKLWGKTWRKGASAVIDGVIKLRYEHKQRKIKN